jgi:hypothetical protein
LAEINEQCVNVRFDSPERLQLGDRNVAEASKLPIHDVALSARSGHWTCLLAFLEPISRNESRRSFESS